MGCNASHKKAIEFAKHYNFDDVFIFEDDFDFISENSKAYIDQANEMIPEDYDVALFGYYFLPKKIKVNEYWNEVGDFCALHLYKVNSKAYDKILALPDDYHIDRLIGRSTLKKYASVKLATKQISDLSSISGKVTDYDFMLNKFEKI
jgi:GR25 family glycosyltransferase involved in LPS biosynthesis